MKKLWRKIKRYFNQGERSENRVPTGMYPKAIYVPEAGHLKQIYDFGKWPEVYVVHFTAGWNTRTGKDFMLSFKERGLCADFMDKDGQIFQNRDGNRGGYHAGKSKFLGRSSVSRFAAGIEIACGGKLKKDGTTGEWKTWFGKVVPEQDRRYATKTAGYQQPGWYEKYTQAQEDSLAEFLAWQIKQGVVHIVGHDEIATPHGRKNDPGGSLSMPLGKFIAEKVMPLVL